MSAKAAATSRTVAIDDDGLCIRVSGHPAEVMTFATIAPVPIASRVFVTIDPNAPLNVSIRVSPSTARAIARELVAAADYAEAAPAVEVPIPAASDDQGVG